MSETYHLSTLARDIAPYLHELLGIGTASVTGTGSSVSGAHEIGGPLHTGTLRNDQGPQFVLLDGSRPLQNNWSFRPSVQIDGMDPSAHVERTVGDDWTHHSIATGTAPITVSSAQNVAIALGETMTVVSSKLELKQPGSVSATTGNTLSSDQGAGRHTHAVTATQFGDEIFDTLLKNSGSGSLYIYALWTSQIYSRAGTDTMLRPAKWVYLYPGENQIRIGPTAMLRTDHFESGFEKAGWAIDYDGNADLTHILADTLEVQAFVADVERVLAGAQRVTKSMGILALDFAIGYDSQIHVEDLPGFSGFENFEPGDYIRLRVMDRSGGGLIVGDSWYLVSGYHDNEDGTQRWNVTHAYSSPGVYGNLVAKKGLLVLDYGHQGQATGGSNPGYWHVTTIEPYSPYAEIVTWAFPPWDYSNNTVRVRLGLLTGVTGDADEWGFWVSGGSPYKYAVMSNQQFELHSITASWYVSNTEVLRIEPGGDGNPSIRMASTASLGSLPTFTTGTGIWIGTDAGTAKFRVGTATGNRIVWNGSQLIVRGLILLEDGTVVGDDGSSTGIIVTGAWDVGQNYIQNRSMVSYAGGSYIATTTHTSTASGNAGPPGIGQYWELVAAPGTDNQDFSYLYENYTDVPAGFSGLFMSGQRMGYMFVGAWRTYMDNSGNFWLGGTSGNYISFNQTTGEFAGYKTNTKQWYARNSDGSFRWAGGNGLLDATGMHIQQETSTDLELKRSVSWWSNVETRTGLPAATVRSWRTAESYSKIAVESYDAYGAGATTELGAYDGSTGTRLLLVSAGSASTAYVFANTLLADVQSAHIGPGPANSSATLRVQQVLDSQVGIEIDMRGTASGIALNVQRGGINRFQVRPHASTNDIYVLDANLGNNVRGSVVWVGANTNPSGAAGYGPGHLAMKSSANAWQYLFVDSSGTLRISSSDATGGTGSATRNANSTGTVVGLQSSLAEEKFLAPEKPSTEDALERLQRAARVALRAFRYKDDRYNGEYFPNGLVIDFAPQYGLDRSDAYPQGRVRNDIVLSADLIAAVDYILHKLEQLENGRSDHEHE